MEKTKQNELNYGRVHKWLLKYHKESKKECEHCSCTDKKLDFALIHGKEHEKNRSNYIILCRKCHTQYDVHSLTDEHKEKISKNHARYWKDKQSPFKNKKHKAESITKMSEANKGKVPWNKGIRNGIRT